MTIQIKHAFVSLKGDGTDATQVQPSYWNAAHSFTMATNRLVGRLTAGAGSAEEIEISAYMASLLSTADAVALAGVLGLFETGDCKYTFRSAASPGWVLMLGGTGTPPNTIGNAASGAALRANADCLALYTVVYNACADADAPVSGGRTGNPTNDFNSGKTILIPNLVGRSPLGAGVATNAPPGGGAATTAKVIGRGYGAETVTLVTGNLPPYTPAGTNTGGAASYNFSGASFDTGFALVQGTAISPGPGTPALFTQPTFNGVPQGGTSQPVNNIHASIALNVMVKL